MPIRAEEYHVNTLGFTFENFNTKKVRACQFGKAADKSKYDDGFEMNLLLISKKHR